MRLTTVVALMLSLAACSTASTGGKSERQTCANPDDVKTYACSFQDPTPGFGTYPSNTSGQPALPRTYGMPNGAVL